MCTRTHMLYLEKNARHMQMIYKWTYFDLKCSFHLQVKGRYNQANQEKKQEEFKKTLFLLLISRGN